MYTVHISMHIMMTTAGDPLVVEVGEVTDTRELASGDLFYFTDSYTEDSLWPGKTAQTHTYPLLLVLYTLLEM